MTLEEWRDIEGYEGLYQVSNLGNVRGLDRINSYGRFVCGRTLVATPSTSGYPYVTLWAHGEPYRVTVHLLVLRAFKGQAEDMQCNHINGVKTDNRLENLEWCTPSQNTRHAFRLGLATGHKGEKNGASKLVRSQVREIRRLYEGGEHTQQMIADMFGISDAMVSYIVNRVKWTHV